MYRLTLILTLLGVFGVSICLADKPRLTNPAHRTPRLDSPQLQKRHTSPSRKVIIQRTPRLDSPQLQKRHTSPSRKVIIKTLMEDPTTKEALTEEAEKLGFSASRLETLAVNPLPTETVLSTEQMTDIQGTIADQRAYMELDWENGITFTISDIPTYGPSNYKLGFMNLHPCRIISENSNSRIYLIPDKNAWRLRAMSLSVELPMGPGLYAITFKISRPEGPCYPGWHEPGRGNAGALLDPVAAPIYGRAAWGKRTGLIGGPVIPLTPLPDKTGYTGLLNANIEQTRHLHPRDTDALPAEIIGDGKFGMRKCTAIISLGLNPVYTHPEWEGIPYTHPDEPMTNLIFESITIMRL